MAVRRLLQSRSVATGLLIALLVVGITAVAASTVIDPAPRVRHSSVTLSAGITILWMLMAWALMLAMPREQQLARLTWTLGLVMLGLHLLVAFGVAHGWSHAAAVQHVRDVGGPGAGIVVNYLFAVVWLADVVWWWSNPAGHSTRPRWVGWVTHCSLAFVVVNATVVFGPAKRRWVYAAGLGLIGVLGVLRSRMQ